MAGPSCSKLCRSLSSAIRPSVVPTSPTAGATRASEVSTSSLRFIEEAATAMAVAAVRSSSSALYWRTTSGASFRIRSLSEPSAMASASPARPRRTSAAKRVSSS